MTLPSWFQGAVLPWLPALVAIFIAVLTIWGARRLLRMRAKATGASPRLATQLMVLLLTFIAIVVIVLLLPISESSQGQLLSLLGFLLSAAIALSSTTFIGNAMAGLMIRTIYNIRLGDYIRIGEHAGRVSERGLLHTEIQTEDRDLTTLPNLHLVTQPVTVVRSSGTVLSANVSLGYDVPRSKVEKCLLEAAREADLRDAFVQVVDLGDFSVTYRIAGILEEVKFLVSARSRLRACMLDALHGAQIEIVSPTFMNQRQISTNVRIIPKHYREEPRPIGPEAPPPETRIFDKAEEAEAEELVETTKAHNARRLKELDELLEDPDVEHRSELEEERAIVERMLELCVEIEGSVHPQRTSLESELLRERERLEELEKALSHKTSG